MEGPDSSSSRIVSVVIGESSTDDNNNSSTTIDTPSVPPQDDQEKVPRRSVGASSHPRQRQPQQRQQQLFFQRIPILHILTLFIYSLPLFRPQQPEEAVLDELHIVSRENQDVNGPRTSWATIFTNDYWGRPLTFHASHKSWRPLTVLSFRYLRGFDIGMSDLTMHRVVNVITHAAAHSPRSYWYPTPTVVVVVVPLTGYTL
jgi:hypothetical protein